MDHHARLRLDHYAQALDTPVFEVKDRLEEKGFRVRIVSVVNPHRLYRPCDIAWSTVSSPDGDFVNDDLPPLNSKVVMFTLGPRRR